jgi:hypothetical protein
MRDVVDFRISDKLAIGYDDFNVIIFRVNGHKEVKGYPWFDDASWKAIYFVYMDKAVLLRALRDFGWKEPPETNPRLAAMPEDVRLYRERLYSRVGCVRQP